MSTPTQFTWTDDLPAIAGWYAVIKCWDTDEGFFPDGTYFDGEEWQVITAPIIAHAGPFPAKEEAVKWADAHDPDDPATPAGEAKP